MIAPPNRPVALVTGASKRIGAAIAQQLHTQGYNIAIHYGQSEADARSLAEVLNRQVADSAALFQADLRDVAAIDRLVAQLHRRWGRVDALINNASTFFPTPLNTSSEAAWHELLDSNLKGPYFLAQRLADSLCERRGCIVNITDINARQPLKGYPIYCIAKAGLAMLTRTLARELAPTVRVNAVAPGSILWPEGKAEMTDQAKAELLDQIPLQRLGSPDDIAALVCFLVTSARYVTGQIIAADGGLSLG